VTGKELQRCASFLDCFLNVFSENFVTKYIGHAGGKERGGRGGKERNRKSQE
jgi:hypothetical protein